MFKSKQIVKELFFYLVLTLLLWNIFNDKIGEYYALLLSTVPGFIYTVYNFFRYRQYSISGIFIIVSLIISRAVDIASLSAEKILWNRVYLDVTFTLFWLITILIKKPLGMYFFIDYAYLLSGIPRENTKKLYKNRGLFKYFQLFSLLFVIDGIIEILLKMYLINHFGIDGFNEMTIILRIWGYLSGAVKLLFVGYIIKKLKSYKVD